MAEMNSIIGGSNRMQLYHLNDGKIIAINLDDEDLKCNLQGIKKHDDSEPMPFVRLDEQIMLPSINETLQPIPNVEPATITMTFNVAENDGFSNWIDNFRQKYLVCFGIKRFPRSLLTALKFPKKKKRWFDRLKKYICKY